MARTFLSKHFASSRDYAEWFTVQPQSPAEQRGYSFYGDTQRITQGHATLLNGDESNLSRAQALLDQFQESIEVPTLTPALSLAGGFPDVPAFLSGQPEHMWTLAPDLSERTPLRILVGLSSSAGVPREDLAKRGCTLAAFALALSSRRPVYITPFVIDGNRRIGARALISWDIATSPLVLSELMGCLSSPNVTRYLGLASTARLHPPCDGSVSPYDFTEQDARKHIRASPSDLYLPPIHLYDPLVSDPINWIRTNLAKYADDNEGSY